MVTSLPGIIVRILSTVWRHAVFVRILLHGWMDDVDDA